MKLFQREQRSLFGEILDWMLTPLLLLWPVSLVLTWLVAQGIAGKPFDRALEYNVQALAQLVVVKGSKVQFNLPAPAREILRADDADLVYYQVLGARGEFLSGDRDMPQPPEDEVIETSQVKLRNDEINGQEVRIAYVYVANNTPQNKPVLVQVAETLEKRSVLATEIVKGVMVPQFVVLPLAVLLVWFALVRGIRPLSQLEARIQKRKPDDLSPIDAIEVPIEVAPLVEAVNGLLQKLKVSNATQKRFLADAAHQLKTPLAGLRMQADLAQRANASAEELKHSLRQVSRSSIRATHTVNQLLALARTEASGLGMSRQMCNVAALTIEVVQDCLPRALDKHLDMGYEGAGADSEDCMVEGQNVLIKEMVRNLIDNAIHYTPSDPETPGIITVRVFADPADNNKVILQVEDNGPGIPQAERAQVLQPFYRSLGSNTDGSGLGLAIVAEVVKQHQASLSIEDAHPGLKPGDPSVGAKFTVRLNKTSCITLS